MEERRRTRSQGPPSLSENNELIQWDSLQDPVWIEREHAEARRLARQVDTATNIDQNRVESSEISQIVQNPIKALNTCPNQVRSCQKKRNQKGKHVLC